jgi:hypothetical protein
MLLTLVPDSLRRSVGNPLHRPAAKTSLELSFRAGAPTDGAPLGMARMSPAALDRLSGMYHASGDDRGWILTSGKAALEVPRNTDRPGKLASRGPLAGRQPISASAGTLLKCTLAAIA